MMSLPEALFIGGAHLDRVAYPTVAFHSGASHPGRVRESIGGACFNAARAFSAFGGKASFMGARGGDANGDLVASAISQARMTDIALTWLDRSTPSYSALLDHEGELVGAVADMDLYDLLTPRIFRRRHWRDALANAPGILIDANLPSESCSYLAQSAGGRLVAGIAVSRSKVVKLRPALSSLSVLFMTRFEAASLLERPHDCPAPSLAIALRDAGLQMAVITEGANPVTMLDGDRIARQPSTPVKDIKDVTGAGDTLAGVAFHSLLSGRPLIESVRLGMVSAARHIGGGLPVNAAFQCREDAERLPAPQFID